VTGEHKWAAFYGSQAFVLASHSENFGIVVAEALACSKPVLITDKVNIWREVEGDGAGLVSADAVDPFADILARFLALGEVEQAQMGERARKCFMTRFHIGAATHSLVSAIDKHKRRANGGASSMNSPRNHAQ
jgi:glycosyltransferase involved in cell wall biosynthesis